MHQMLDSELHNFRSRRKKNNCQEGKNPWGKQLALWAGFLDQVRTIGTLCSAGSSFRIQSQGGLDDRAVC